MTTCDCLSLHMRTIALCRCMIALEDTSQEAAPPLLHSSVQQAQVACSGVPSMFRDPQRRPYCAVTGRPLPAADSRTLFS